MQKDNMKTNIKALKFAVLSGKTEDVRQMLDKDMAVHLDREKVLMFSIATAANMDGKMTKLLLEKGANPCAESEPGYSALILAAQTQNRHSAKYLLEAGADIFTSFAGKTALDYAKEGEDTALIDLLKKWEYEMRNSPQAKAKRQRSVRRYLKNRRAAFKK